MNSYNQTKHARRVVGHVSGWKEQLDICLCGKPWPCPEADTLKDTKEVERLRERNALLTKELDKRRFWLNPKDFDAWKDRAEAKIELLEGALKSLTISCSLPADAARIVADTLQASEAIGPNQNAVDAARYRFLRQPGNAIVSVKNPRAFGQNAGPVRYDTPERLDEAIDRARYAPGERH